MKGHPLRCNFRLSIMVVLILFISVGCAHRKSILETPLKYGDIQSSDSIKFSNVNMKILSDAIVKIKQTQFYSVQQIAENRYRVVDFNFTENYSGNASLKVERTTSFDIFLNQAEANSIIMKIENGRTLVKHTGKPISGNIKYIVQTDKNKTISLNLLGRTLPPDFINNLNEGLNRPPKSYELNEKESAYSLKEFALLMEEKIQK